MHSLSQENLTPRTRSGASRRKGSLSEALSRAQIAGFDLDKAGPPHVATLSGPPIVCDGRTALVRPPQLPGSTTLPHWLKASRRAAWRGRLRDAFAWLATLAVVAVLVGGAAYLLSGPVPEFGLAWR